jgi:hypothetical protein
MEELNKYLGESFYTHLLSFSASIFGLYISLKKSRGIFKVFSFYFFCYCLSQILFFQTTFFKEKEIKSLAIDISIYGDFLFTLIEFCIFMRLFNRVINGPSKILLTLIELAFLATSFFLLFTNVKHDGISFVSTLEEIYLIESILLLLPCIMYFIQIFNSIQPLSLIQDGFFWVITGLTFFLISTLPFSYLMNYLRKENFEIYMYLYSIVYLFYCLLFVMIIRGILCKTTIIK